MKNILIYLCSFILSSSLWAQHAGDLDSTFGMNGVATFEFESCRNFANSITFFDNKLYLGSFMMNQSDCNRQPYDLQVGGVARIDTFGVLDTSFNGTGSTDRLRRYWPHALVNPNNGQVILTGYDSIGTPYWGHYISGFLPNGEVDTSFNNGQLDFGTANHERSRGSGINPLTGEFALVGWTDDFNIMTSKFLPTGQVDSSFGNNGFVAHIPPGFNGGRSYAVTFQPDGKVISFGSTGGTGLPSNFVFIRYTAQGQLDSTFGTNGFATAGFAQSVGHTYRGYGVKVQNDGKILGVGTAQGVAGIVRLNADGSPDNSFGNGGLVGIDYPAFTNGWDLAIQDDGKILVLIEDNDNFIIERLNTDGTSDTTFGNNGAATFSFSNYNQFVLREIGIWNHSIYGAGFAVTNSGVVRTAVVKLRSRDRINNVHLSEFNRSRLEIYPNPATDHLRISGMNLFSASLSVYNSLGTKFKVDYSPDGQDLLVNTFDLPPGLYFFQVSNGTKHYAEKVLIE